MVNLNNWGDISYLVSHTPVVNHRELSYLEHSGVGLVHLASCYPGQLAFSKVTKVFSGENPGVKIGTGDAEMEIKSIMVPFWDAGGMGNAPNSMADWFATMLGIKTVGLARWQALVDHEVVDNGTVTLNNLDISGWISEIRDQIDDQMCKFRFRPRFMSTFISDLPFYKRFYTAKFRQNLVYELEAKAEQAVELERLPNAVRYPFGAVHAVLRGEGCHPLFSGEALDLMLARNDVITNQTSVEEILSKIDTWYRVMVNDPRDHLTVGVGAPIHLRSSFRNDLPWWLMLQMCIGSVKDFMPKEYHPKVTCHLDKLSDLWSTGQLKIMSERGMAHSLGTMERTVVAWRPETNVPWLRVGIPLTGGNALVPFVWDYAIENGTQGKAGVPNYASGHINIRGNLVHAPTTTAGDWTIIELHRCARKMLRKAGIHNEKLDRITFTVMDNINTGYGGHICSGLGPEIFGHIPLYKGKYWPLECPDWFSLESASEGKKGKEKVWRFFVSFKPESNDVKLRSDGYIDYISLHQYKVYGKAEHPCRRLTLDEESVSSNWERMVKMYDEIDHFKWYGIETKLQQHYDEGMEEEVEYQQAADNLKKETTPPEGPKDDSLKNKSDNKKEDKKDKK